MTRSLRAWVVGLALVLLCGCALGGGEAPGANLEDRELLFESAEGFTLVPDTNIRLRFTEGEVHFNAGCNSHGGPFQVRDGRLIVPGLGSTEIGCDPPLSEQDRWLADFLTSMPMIVLDGPRITLIGDDATLVFLDRTLADPDRPLVGPTWTIDTLVANGGASAFFPTPPSTLEFGADGTLHVDTSCNTGNAQYVATDSELTLTDVTFTDAACAPSNMHGDAHIQSLLSPGTLTFSISANRLTLMRDNLGVAATTE